MDKYCITGFSGFVCKYFMDYLESRNEEVRVLGLDVNEPNYINIKYKYISFDFKKVDMLNKNLLKKTLSHFKPNFVIHLAAYSSVAYSWGNPVLSFQNNTNIFLNLIDTLRKLKIQARILSVGSSEEYGNVESNEIPISESNKLKPISPYAVARISQEMMSKVYVHGYGMDIVMTRSFNHIGPGQKDIFVVSSFAKQMATQKQQGNDSIILTTGDVSIIRDFLDVRDVVRAYYLLLHNGLKGEVYNVCSGRGMSLEELINTMANLINMKVTIQRNPELLRPTENRVVIGNNSKVMEHTDWKQKISLDKSLNDILEYWKYS